MTIFLMLVIVVNHSLQITEVVSEGARSNPLFLSPLGAVIGSVHLYIER